MCVLIEMNFLTENITRAVALCSSGTLVVFPPLERHQLWNKYFFDAFSPKTFSRALRVSFTRENVMTNNTARVRFA